MRFLELEENLDELAKWRFTNPPKEHTKEGNETQAVVEKRIGYYGSPGSLDWRFMPRTLECYQKKTVLQSVARF